MTPTSIRADLAGFSDLLYIAPGVPWIGPVERAEDYVKHGRVWRLSIYSAEEELDEFIRLPLDRRECRAQLAAVMLAGLRCPDCDGTKRVPGMGDCLCGTGYLRKPSDPRHLLPVAELGSLPDEYAHHSAALLKAHAEGVAGGGVGVQDILAPWQKVCDDDPDTGETWVRRRLVDPRNHGGGLWVCERLQVWRDFGWENSCVQGPNGMWLRGPETGEEGQRLADEAALNHGLALVDPNGLRVPSGGGA